METIQHKCPNCGADVVLSPQTGAVCLLILFIGLHRRGA